MEASGSSVSGVPIIQDNDGELRFNQLEQTLENFQV